MEVNGLVEEVEALKSIYFRELEVTNDDSTNVPTRISINLHPATADNTQEQYVCLTLVINLPLNYPNELPEIAIRNPRGLSDEDFNRIKSDLQAKASASRGNAMLYELIEIAKEHLTTGNTPRCACAICLYGFTDDDVFTKTGCYHYFHSHCLARYVGYVIDTPVSANPLAEGAPDEEVKVLCPVCREPIEYDLETLKAPPPLQSEGAAPFELNTELVKLQQQMSELFDKQKSQGGIIDLEAEKNKYLLEISSVPSEVDAGQSNAGARTDSKSASHKASKKDPQRSGQKSGVQPVAQDRDENRQQQDRRQPRDAKRNQPPERNSAVPNGGPSDRQNHHRGRGGGAYRTNGRRPEDGMVGGYPNRNNRGWGGYDRQRENGERNHASQRHAQNERQPPNSNLKNSTNDAAAAVQPQYQHRHSNTPNFRSPEGPNNHSGNGYRRPYSQRGWGRGRGQHQQTHERSAVGGDVETVENGTTAPPKKMNWAEQVGEEDSPPPQEQQQPPRTETANRRRGYNHNVAPRRPPSFREDGVDRQENSRDSYKKRNNNYRNYNRRWNAPSPDKAPPPSNAEPAGGKAAGREVCPDKTDGGGSGGGSESIPVSRFMVLTGPPTKAFAVGGLGDAERRQPPAFLQAKEMARGAAIKAFAPSLPPGFKTRSEIVAPPPGFEGKI